MQLFDDSQRPWRDGLNGKWRDRLKRYAESLALRHEERKLAVLVDANRCTHGHRYLIKSRRRTGATGCIILVKEDTSRFPYEDRLTIWSAKGLPISRA